LGGKKNRIFQNCPPPQGKQSAEMTEEGDREEVLGERKKKVFFPGKGTVGKASGRRKEWVWRNKKRKKEN